MAENQGPAPVLGDHELYKKLLFAGIAIIGALLILAWITQNRSLKFGEIEFNGGLTFFELALFYSILSFKTASADAIAGAYCYGRALSKLGSGPHFLPFGLMQIKSKSRLVQEFQCPGEPEKVFRGHDNEPLTDKDMVRPIRVVTRAPDPDPTKGETGILDAQMTLIVSFVVQYAITDIFNFVANFGDEKQVEKQVRDIGEIIIAEVASGTTPAGFIKKLPETNDALRKKMRDRLNHLGITIESVRLISPDVSLAVSNALAGIPVARATAEQEVITAEADKTKAIKAGEGVASATRAKLMAEAEGRKKMLDALGVSGEAVLASETAKSLINANTVVVGAGGGMTDLMGVVKAAQTVLQPKGDKS